MTFVNGTVVTNVNKSSSGVSARVYKNGSFGFSSNPEISDQSIKGVINAAENNAEFLDFIGSNSWESFINKSFNFEKDFYTKKNRVSKAYIMDFLKEIDGYIKNKYVDLSNRVVSYSSLEMEKNLITSYGSSLYSMLPRTRISVMLTIEKDGEPIDAGDSFGGLGQFEDLFNEPRDLFPKIDELYNHLKNKVNGVYASAGIKDCILAPKLAGILAHEAIGHTTEADLVLGGSIAGKNIGKVVASPLVTLCDFANTYGNSVCPMPIYIDDEGTKAEDVVIIKDGVLKNFMHNKETAKIFNVEPTGNGRAYEFYDEPLVRMRNTAILPGTSKLKDMIESIEDGYYLMIPSNGQADTTSEFMFGVTLGYEIKNGKVGRAIKNTTISGVAFNMLKTITMISDDMSWENGGMCGKKQPIPVGLGGPAIKCKINIGGK